MRMMTAFLMSKNQRKKIKNKKFINKKNKSLQMNNYIENQEIQDVLNLNKNQILKDTMLTAEFRMSIE